MGILVLINVQWLDGCAFIGPEGDTKASSCLRQLAKSWKAARREGKCCAIPEESSSPSAVWKEANKIFSLINSRRPGLRVLGTAQGDEEA